MENNEQKEQVLDILIEILQGLRTNNKTNSNQTIGITTTPKTPASTIIQDIIKAKQQTSNLENIVRHALQTTPPTQPQSQLTQTPIEKVNLHTTNGITTYTRHKKKSGYIKQGSQVYLAYYLLYNAFTNKSFSPKEAKLVLSPFNLAISMLSRIHNLQLSTKEKQVFGRDTYKLFYRETEYQAGKHTHETKLGINTIPNNTFQKQAQEERKFQAKIEAKPKEVKPYTPNHDKLDQIYAPLKQKYELGKEFTEMEGAQTLAETNNDRLKLYYFLVLGKLRAINYLNVRKDEKGNKYYSCKKV